MEKVTLEQAIKNEQTKINKEEVLTHMNETVNNNEEKVATNQGKMDPREIIQQMTINNELFIQSNRVEMINLDMDTKVIQNLDAKLELGKKILDLGILYSDSNKPNKQELIEQGDLLIHDVIKSLSDMRAEMAKQLNNKKEK